jgi:hypothetical protein
MNQRNRKVIVVLDTVTGRVHRFFYRGDPEGAVERWADQRKIRLGDCSWMTTTLDRARLP